jgi:hypothetical protein
MPYTPTTPESKNVPGPVVSKELTTLHIHRLDIHVDPVSNEVSINVRWSKGFMDNANYVAVEMQATTLQGEDVVAAIGATTSGTHSIYSEVKTAVWQILAARNLVPAGTIS